MFRPEKELRGNKNVTSFSLILLPKN